MTTAPNLAEGERLPQNIGRLHLGDRVSDGEGCRCNWDHDIPGGQALYWPEQMGRHDDSSPLCLEHAIEQYANDTGCGASAGSDLKLGAAQERILELEARLASLLEALTPSGDTKAAYIGEFHMGIMLRHRGQEDYRRVPIEWTTIKQIMAAICARAAADVGREG